MDRGTINIGCKMEDLILNNIKQTGKFTYNLITTFTFMDEYNYSIERLEDKVNKLSNLLDETVKKLDTAVIELDNTNKKLELFKKYSYFPLFDLVHLFNSEIENFEFSLLELEKRKYNSNLHTEKSLRYRDSYYDKWSSSKVAMDDKYRDLLSFDYLILDYYNKADFDFTPFFNVKKIVIFTIPYPKDSQIEHKTQWNFKYIKSDIELRMETLENSQVEHIELHGFGIVDFKGISKLKNLKKLIISHSKRVNFNGYSTVTEILNPEELIENIHQFRDTEIILQNCLGIETILKNQDQNQINIRCVYTCDEKTSGILNLRYERVKNK